MRNFAVMLVAIATILTPTLGFGGALVVIPTITTPTHETRGSIGLRFEFGDTIKPSVVAAVRSTRTDTNNNVSGALADVSVPITPDGNFLPVIRLLGIFGNQNVQGLAGVGYDFSTNQGILGLAAQIRQLQGGIHVGLDGEVKPYVEVSTYSGPPSPTTTAGEPELPL